MAIATITSKGQVTLPADVRRYLHLDTGERVEFCVNEENGTVLLIPLNKKVDDIFGILGKKRGKKAISAEDMNQGISKRLAAEYK
jgi:AbrB family looped-hinge helix DNA binding protein